jgi:hypothetical protein
VCSILHLRLSRRWLRRLQSCGVSGRFGGTYFELLCRGGLSQAETVKQQTAARRLLLLLCYSAYYSTVNMDAIYSSKTSEFLQTALYHNADFRSAHIHIQIWCNDFSILTDLLNFLMPVLSSYYCYNFPNLCVGISRIMRLFSSCHVEWVSCHQVAECPGVVWRRRPPGMEYSCQYIEAAVLDSRQIMISKFRLQAVGANNPSSRIR